MRFVKTTGMLLVGAMLAGSMGIAMAQKSPADMVKSRQDAMKALGADYKIINDSLKTDAPDKMAIAGAAKRIADGGKNILSLFPVGTGAEAGVKTRAKAEIWAQPAEFKAAEAKSAAASTKFVQVAAGGSLDAIKAGFKDLTDGCGACHMPFRAPAEPAPK